MCVWANLYKCQKCGETWRVEHHEEIDTDNDDVYEILFCLNCGSQVNEPILDAHGRQTVHVLTESEIEDEQSLYTSLYNDEDV